MIFFYFCDTKDQIQRQRHKSNLKLSSAIPFEPLLSHIRSILLSGSFWTTGLISTLMYGSLIVFLANFSLLGINHLHVSHALYGWLQATVMLSFVLGSFLCAAFMKKIPIVKWGIMLAIGGSLALLWFTYQFPRPLFLMASIIPFNIGAAFLIGVFSTKVIQLFSESKGLVSSLIGSLRMVISALFVAFSSFLFDGSFRPLGWLIFLASLISLILLLIRSRFFPEHRGLSPNRSIY
jgi:DHA1 family bicyclomycin/chloramphenicol resistance-like MFS transporter